MDKITLGTKKVSIEFPGVKALSDCDFEISTGMIHAVMGANGAGKSTLMKVLAGSNPGYTGDVLYNGKVVEVRTPAAAKKLGIPLYDRNVLEKEAEEIDSTLHSLVEFSKNGMSTSGYYKMAYPLGIGSTLKKDRMFEVQSKLVLEHAEKESCVIIGRCADYLLRERENVVRCYIFAPYQARIRNSIMTLGLANAEPQRIIEEVDKARAEYYRSHTGCEVNNTRYRDLFLNSNLLGVEGTADLIVDAARRKFGLAETPAEEA